MCAPLRPSLPKQHLVGISSTHPKNNTTLYSLDADFVSPGGAGDYDPDNPPVATRLVFYDTDHSNLWDARPTHVWKGFCRGQHVIYQENEFSHFAVYAGRSIASGINS